MVQNPLVTFPVYFSVTQDMCYYADISKDTNFGITILLKAITVVFLTDGVLAKSVEI